uniref:Mediator of RNA polymerase II transcription subunit 23 n=1 Tax=Steinernema glaseri TaxID=37863 RepID=A0A1I7YV71_9BILA
MSISPQNDKSPPEKKETRGQYALNSLCASHELMPDNVMCFWDNEWMFGLLEQVFLNEILSDCRTVSARDMFSELFSALSSCGPRLVAEPGKTKVMPRTNEQIIVRKHFPSLFLIF